MTTLFCGDTKKVRTPEGYKVKGQSYDSLEAIALTVNEIFQKAGIIDSCGVIDCLRLLEETIPKYARVNYSIREDQDMEGCAAFVIPDRKLLIVSNSVYNGLFTNDNYSRSTIVHEFSHLALDHALTLHRGATTEHGFFEDSEWQAKALTAAIMMPRKICQEYVLDPNGLAKHCQVSLQTATYRLNRLLKDKKISPQGNLGAFM